MEWNDFSTICVDAITSLPTSTGSGTVTHGERWWKQDTVYCAMNKKATASSSSWSNGALVHISLALGLLLWMKWKVMDSLRIPAIEMSHLDPTEIISHTFPMFDLVVFVGGTMTCLFLCSVPWWDIRILSQQLFQISQVTVLLWSGIILCGADPIQQYAHTALTSMYIASLLSWNPGLPLSCSILQHNRSSRLATCRSYGTLITVVPCSLLLILDWGAQIQRWPIPLLLGSTIGWSLGTCIGLLWEIHPTAW